MAAIIRRSDGDIAEALRRRSDSDHGGDQAAVRRRPQATIMHCSDQAAISHEPMCNDWEASRWAIRQQTGSNQGSDQVARSLLRGPSHDIINFKTMKS